jgi:drug/metabolite transporter (DMT)-like permease
MLADIDTATVFELTGYVLKMWLVLVALGLPAQALLVLALRSEQRHRRVIAAIGAAVVVVVAALITVIANFSYDGALSHTLVLWVTLIVFTIPAHLLLFFAIFRLKRILSRLAALTGAAALMMVGIIAFGARALAYGFQHSLGGWP